MNSGGYAAKLSSGIAAWIFFSVTEKHSFSVRRKKIFWFNAILARREELLLQKLSVPILQSSVMRIRGVRSNVIIQV